MKWGRVRPGALHRRPLRHPEPGDAPTDLDRQRAGLHRRGREQDRRQAAAQRSAHARLIDISDAYTVVPVVNDVAEYAGLRCRVSMITTTADGTPLYCLVKPRGKRQCLLRNEFKVVMP